jgi:chitodextrinase
MGRSEVNATLTWTANAEPDLDHYEVHYGRASGVYSAVVETPDAEYSFQDLLDGVRWYFAVKAVDTSGNASAFSTEVSKINKRVRIR